MSDPFITRSPLSAALGVNGMIRCDCGCTAFEIGLAINLVNGNNFIRILECCSCGKQMPATHQSDAQLAPSI